MVGTSGGGGILPDVGTPNGSGKVSNGSGKKSSIGGAGNMSSIFGSSIGSTLLFN